jgi:hypothetical protein
MPPLIAVLALHHFSALVASYAVLTYEFANSEAVRSSISLQVLPGSYGSCRDVLTRFPRERKLMSSNGVLFPVNKIKCRTLIYDALDLVNLLGVLCSLVAR